mmetsp:Transcript_69773/g.110700  ORF Transcript_69773/g.110700 Transcript_69773/m.110700 type:complete len:117 (+) Transcript_69773:1-351(+)
MDRAVKDDGQEIWVPGAFHMVAVPCDEAGESGAFVVVSCGGLAMHHEEQHLCEYSSDALAFWNPLHRVFIRINENGDFDSSVVVNPVAGELKMPNGWYRERFVLQLSQILGATQKT